MSVIHPSLDHVKSNTKAIHLEFQSTLISLQHSLLKSYYNEIHFCIRDTFLYILTQFLIKISFIIMTIDFLTEFGNHDIISEIILQTIRWTALE